MPDLYQILQNLESILNPLTALVVIISFICGIVFVWMGLTQLKKFGQTPGQMTQPGEFKGPFVEILVGAVLIYIPTTTDIVTNTLLGGAGVSIFSGNIVNIGFAGEASNSILAYSPIPIEQKWQAVINTIFHYVQFIGFIAFVRGWFMLAKAGHAGGQPGNFSKGLVHIIGGVIAINIIPVLAILQNTILGS